jgi:hypothetical protein
VSGGHREFLRHFELVFLNIHNIYLLWSRLPKYAIGSTLNLKAQEITIELPIWSKRVKKKLCHKIFEKPRKKQKFDNIFDSFCLNHKPSHSNCFLPTRKQQNINTV